MATITQKISNSKIFPDVERTIQIGGVALNFNAKILDIYYRILYTKNDDNISQMFTQQVPDWHIDNAQFIIVRDENFNPIPNPEFVEQIHEEGNVSNENERFLKTPAFDYLANIITNSSMPLDAILRNYILEEDLDGRFNF